jgi:hypothetical protein
MPSVSLDAYKVAARLKIAEIVGPSQHSKSGDTREVIFTLPWRNETLDEYLDELTAKLLKQDRVRKQIEQKQQIGGLKIAMGSLRQGGEKELSEEDRRRIMASLRSKLSQRENLQMLDDQIKGLADVVVEGTYFFHAQTVTLAMEMKQRLGTILASTNLDIPLEMIRPSSSVAPSPPPVPPSFVPPSSSPVPLPSLPSKLSLSIQTERERYQADEPVVVYITASSDCYLILIYSDPEGRGLQIFPNDFLKDNRIKGGVEQRIPDDRSPFEFWIRPPFGHGAFYAFASTQKIEVPVMRPAFGGRVVDGDAMEVIDALEQRAREQGIDSATATCTIFTGK